MDATLFELLFTITACAALLVLFMASVAVLPWTEQELDEVELSLRALVATVMADPVLTEPMLDAMPVPRSSYRVR